MHKLMWIVPALSVLFAFTAVGCDHNHGEKASGHAGHDSEAMAAGKTEIAQKTCPVMKGKIDPKVYVEYKGRRIYFCCPGCEKKFSMDPEKYVKIVDAEIAKEKG